MFKTLAIAATLTLLAGAADAKSCRDAKGKFMKCPPAAAAPMTPAKKAPNCKKGKLCGNSCISMKDVCHK